MKKRILSYVLSILSYIIACIIIFGIFTLIIKFGFSKVLSIILLIVMWGVGIKALADEIYKKLNS